MMCLLYNSSCPGKAEKHPHMVDVAPKTWNAPCLHNCSAVVYWFGFLPLMFSVPRERNGESQPCENCATQRGNKNQHIPKHPLFWEEVRIFTGKIRSCLPYSLMALSGSLGLVKGTGSRSQGAILDAEWYSSAPDPAGT